MLSCSTYLQSAKVRTGDDKIAESEDEKITAMVNEKEYNQYMKVQHELEKAEQNYNYRLQHSLTAEYELILALNIIQVINDKCSSNEQIYNKYHLKMDIEDTKNLIIQELIGTYVTKAAKCTN